MRDASRASHGDLPSPADLFVGRDGELAAVSRMLAHAQTRLVTLTGPPGIGKTRLAVACASAHAERSGCASVFVDLAPVREPALLMVELAQAVGVEPRGGTDLTAQLAAALGNEERLVVLDNCEHLLAAAPDIGQVLAACPRLRVLATSRERLRLSAEQEFPVPPLAMPAPADVADLGYLAANPSVALLLDRARRTNPGFDLTPANALLLARACVRLEGLPLAIELAAARLKVLTPGELLFRLSSRMEVLAGSTRDVPARQRALRSAITWSYDLLDAAERALFRRLSVFAGRWTLADAGSVCAVNGDDALAMVESLLDKSLIRRLPGDEETAEFSMLESLREYAAEQLASHAEAEETRARHAGHYADLAAQLEASIGLPEERAWVLRAGRHHADLGVALDYCLGAGQDASALSLAAALGWYCYTRGDLGHGQALVDAVLPLTADRRELAAMSDDAPAGGQDGVLLVAGVLAWATGETDRAQELLRGALERSEGRGDARRAAIACAFLGHVARAGGEWDASADWHRRAEAGFRERGNTPGVAWARHDLGLLARDHGDLGSAADLLQASLRDFRELDYPWAVAWSAWGLGTTLSALGRLEEACPLLAEALQVYTDVNDPRGVAQCLEALAYVAGERANYESAARLMGAAAALRIRVAARQPDTEQARSSAVERVLARALGPQDADRLIHAGRTMPAQQAADLAMAVASGAVPWKMQVPFLARQYRVITFDLRGNGRSDRPRNSAAYADALFASDAAAVLDATGTERAVLGAFCSGFGWALLFAAAHPQRVTGMVAIAPTLPIPPAAPWERTEYSFDDVLDTTEGWAKENRHYWRRDWRGYVEFFMSQITSEPHSTKPYDDLVAWGMQTDAETMLCDADAPQQVADEQEAIRLCRSLTCPVLVIGGDQDKIVPPERARRIAELTNAELWVIEGGGHAPHVRYPVAVNHAIRDFADRLVSRPRKQAPWRATHVRPRRALWISSPIGLGHVQRDLAIARAVRRRVPDLEIHWWAQPPVTEVLAGAGEIIHPASSDLVSESAHWESESVNHDLPAFYAFRRMDEILCANYLLFDDAVRDTSYDVWVGDECWEIDYFLHENPERKIAPYVFMTDVIGFLPTDPGDPREAELCTDYNADSIEKRERFPRLRDLSMFIGSFDELPDLSFGPGLPGIRSWSSRWFTSVPYVLPFNPAAYRDRVRLRGRLGYPGHQPFLVAAVGGTAAGVSLLELTCDAFARLRKQVPDARMLLVTGPRIDPRLLPDTEGMDKRGYVPDLFEHLACADAAIVQGGLSTTMELVAAGRPFIYFPLRRHWKQQHFVTHRLSHYRAGLRMDYTTTTADDLATTMRAALAEPGTRPDYRKVPRGGAARAAARIATLLAAQ